MASSLALLVARKGNTQEASHSPEPPSAAFPEEPAPPGPPAGEPAQEAEPQVPPAPAPAQPVPEGPAPAEPARAAPARPPEPTTPAPGPAPLPEPVPPVASTPQQPAVTSRELNELEQPAAPKKRWYGWQTIAADAGWIACAVLASEEDNGTLGNLAVAGYFLGGPIVHWGHGHVGKGFASLGLRLAPIGLLTLALIAYVAEDTEDEGLFHDPGPVSTTLFVAAALMVPGAMVIDAAALAYEEAEPEETKWSPRLSPWYRPRTHAGGLSLTGTF